MRRWVLLGLSVMLFVELAGMPALRVTYIQQGSHIASGKYVSPLGTRVVHAGDVSPICPLIVLMPLDRSLRSYAQESLKDLLGGRE